MTLKEIGQEALALDEHERAAPASTIIDTISETAVHVWDEAVMRRDKASTHGAVSPLTHAWRVNLHVLISAATFF
ncbi:MAG TPA: hypothetical protein VFC07_00285 [Verrucomicrobiae bacterium]|nr:hypothetical protein [Verrucomicrobiae bacterium]